MPAIHQKINARAAELRSHARTSSYVYGPHQTLMHWTRANAERFRYSSGPSVNPAHDYHGRKARWIEKAEAMGWRIVGFADEICRHINHRGWYTRDEPYDRDDILRGAVIALPSRGGKRVLLAGYEDACNPGCYLVEASPVYGDIEGDSHKEGCEQAAREADRLAEIVAEHERECNSAWDELSAARSEFADYLGCAAEANVERREAARTLAGRDESNPLYSAARKHLARLDDDRLRYVELASKARKRAFSALAVARRHGITWDCCAP